MIVGLQAALVAPGIVLGIVAAGLYGLLALPLVLTYRVSRVRATSGEITFEGKRLTSASLHQRTAAGISYCPEGRRIFPNLTTEENLVAGSFGVRTRQLAARLEVVYELFPLLGERRTQQAGSLSGGEQQMLAVGRALMPRPRLLMVEELSLGLAPVVVTQLYETLRTLCAQGLAVVVTEQFQRFEERYSDRWIVLERGTVVAPV